MKKIRNAYAALIAERARLETSAPALYRVSGLPRVVAFLLETLGALIDRVDDDHQRLIELEDAVFLDKDGEPKNVPDRND